jgi:type II restriction enzyme
MYERDPNIRDRQSFVSKEGARYEDFIINILKSDPHINENAIIIKGMRQEKTGKITLDESGRISIDTSVIKINYNSNGITASFLLDNDIIVYSKKREEIVCIISVKKSFRERGGETAYWMVKKREANKPFMYILATPDSDQELFDPRNPTKKNKWRSILTAEMDGVFVINEENKELEYEEQNFKVGKRYFIEFIKSLLD